MTRILPSRTASCESQRQQEYTGIHRNTQEYTGIYRNTQEYTGIAQAGFCILITISCIHVQ